MSEDFSFVDFDEEWYLYQNPDIQRQVENGGFSSGFDHWTKHGKAEGRAPGPNATHLVRSENDHRLHEAETELRRHRNQNSDNYLAPADLRVTALEPKQVLMIGPCGTQHLHAKFSALGNCHFDYVFHNGRMELPDNPPKPASEYDFQIVEVALRSILGDNALSALAYTDIEGHERLFVRASTELRAIIEQILKWNKIHGLLSFVINYAPPQQNLMGRLLPRFDLRNPSFFIDKLNAVLEDEVLKHSNAFIFDLDLVKASIGRRYIQDDIVQAMNHHSFLGADSPIFDRVDTVPGLAKHFQRRVEEHFPEIWNILVAMYRTVIQVDAVKLVVVDIDDTLWKGIAGELDQPDGNIVEGWPLGVIEALSYLRKRGVLLAIVSKNEESRIRELWDKIIGKRFGLENFAIIKINWRPKAENMVELLAAVNLLPRNVVFVDDHPVERDGMKSAFPQMRVIGRFHYYWRQILLWSSETQVPFITDESARRTEMVQAQVVREVARNESSREDFLASLGLRLRPRKLRDETDAAFNRAFELTNKTNQFNTTGRRWTREEFVGLLNFGGSIFTFEVEDKFSQYGTVGVVLVRGRVIEQFVMSCRVAGMDNELAAMSLVVSNIRIDSVGSLGEIVARFKETDANFLCRDFLSRCNFELEGDVWTLSGEKMIEPPTHIFVGQI